MGARGIDLERPAFFLGQRNKAWCYTVKMIGNNFVIWENEAFMIKTPFNPHTPYSEGPHLLVAPKADIITAWEDIEASTAAFHLASKICKVMDEINFAPWFNIQANGNWGLLEGATPFFHIHIYGRNKTDSWGKPIVLRELPKSYQNEPMPESDRNLLIDAFKKSL